jgi:fructose/tagatose bisphosphate aldolase
MCGGHQNIHQTRGVLDIFQGSLMKLELELGCVPKDQMLQELHRKLLHGGVSGAGL